MTIVHAHVGIVASTYQSIPRHEERRNDKAINAVCQLSSEEDNPLVEEGTIEANGSCTGGEAIQSKLIPVFMCPCVSVYLYVYTYKYVYYTCVSSSTSTPVLLNCVCIFSV